MSSKINISRATLEELYYRDGLSQQEIATRFDCSESTVRRRLAEYNLSSRPRGPRPDGRATSSWRCRWSPEVAYAVGLIVSDGSLSKDGRHITFTSTDLTLIETLRRCLRLSNRITETPRSALSVRTSYRVQFGDVVFYQWLLDIGLMPDKSRRLGPLDVPDEYFADFLRGYLDGDGSFNLYTDRWNTFKNPKYVYQRLYTCFSSASGKYLRWLRGELTRLMGTRGGLRQHKDAGVWVLKYAKKDSIRLVRWMYYGLDVPCLERKRALIARYLEEYRTLFDSSFGTLGR